MLWTLWTHALGARHTEQIMVNNRLQVAIMLESIVDHSEDLRLDSVRIG